MWGNRFRNTDVKWNKRKGNGRTCLTNRHVLKYSWVPTNQKVSAGVGCLVHEELEDGIIYIIEGSIREILLVE